MTRRERNTWLALGALIYLASVLMFLRAAGFDLCVWRMF